MSAVGLRLREPLGAGTAGTLGPRAAERPRLRLVVFGVLALLGVLRWRTLMSPAPTVRLLALAGLALLVAETPRLLRDRSRAIRIAVAGAAAVALLPLSGMPLAWLAHLRLAAAVRAIGTGLGALPAVLVPLLGGGPSVRMVITLGAGGLLLASALLLAFAPRPLRGRWLAGVSLPLVVLVVLPGILLAPRLPYLEGLLLFTLLAALAWGDRLRGTQLPVAAALTALAGAAGMLLAPAVHPHRPWLEVQSLAAVPSSARPEQFDFAQHLGPLHWPRTGREMFSVLAPRPDLWKVQDLDLFDGRGFVPGVVPADPLPAPDPAALARFTQTITVTISGMQSHSVIAAGDAAPPQGLRAAVSPGLAPGTWTVSSPLHPGSSYRVQTYSPVPSEAELAHAGSAYPAGALAPYRSMLLPSATLPDVSTPILFAPFHDGATAGLRGSPYGRAYAPRPAAGRRRHPVRLRGTSVCLLASGLHLRRGPAVAAVCAGELPVRRSAGLLPAVLGRDGAAAADGRAAGPGRGRLHHRVRRSRGPRLEGQRPRRPQLGGGVVPALRLGPLRPNARERRRPGHLGPAAGAARANRLRPAPASPGCAPPATTPGAAPDRRRRGPSRCGWPAAVAGAGSGGRVAGGPRRGGRHTAVPAQRRGSGGGAAADAAALRPPRRSEADAGRPGAPAAI